MVKKIAMLTTAALLAAVTAGAAVAQSTGASPADPNNERNQQMAPGNAQPTDPAAADIPRARVPTDPNEEDSARSEEGGPTGTGAGAGESGSGTVVVPDAN